MSLSIVKVTATRSPDGKRTLHVEPGSKVLVQETWTFWYDDREHALVLEAYKSEERASLRSKPKITQDYSRLCSTQSLAPGRIGEAEVPLPEEVTQAALQKFTGSLRIGLASKIKP